ncbi:hypothetical protein IC582_005927 [Cucumis melo]
MRRHNSSSWLKFMAMAIVVLDVSWCVNGDWLVGVGSFDMTGPAAEVNMMGYANMDQVTAGIHFRLRARTFVVARSIDGPRIAFVNLDAGMASQLVTIKVLERLQSRYKYIYTHIYAYVNIGS